MMNVLGIAYPIMMLMCIGPLLAYYWRKDQVWHSLRLPLSLHWKLFIIAFFNATNGVFTLAASPNTRTPPFIQQGLFTLGPFFTSLV